MPRFAPGSAQTIGASLGLGLVLAREYLERGGACRHSAREDARRSQPPSLVIWLLRSLSPPSPWEAG